MISQSLEIEGAEPRHHLVEPERSRHRRLGPGKAAAPLAEAARWSGREADVELPEEPARGAAILATSRNQVASLGSRGFVEIGQVR